MKKTLIFLAAMTAIGAAQAQEYQSLRESDTLVRKQAYVPQNSGVQIQQAPQNIVITQSTSSVVVSKTEAPVATTELVSVKASEPALEKIESSLKGDGKIHVGVKRDGFEPETYEYVPKGRFLGFSYGQVKRVITPETPIKFGHLYYHETSCEAGYNSGRLDIMGNENTSTIPLVLCPSGISTQVSLTVMASEKDKDTVTIKIGNQLVHVTKGTTSLYHLDYDGNNKISFEFVFNEDEHPVRY